MEKDRLKQWEERYLPQVLDQFTPRIRQDLDKLNPPDFGEIVSVYIYGMTGSGKTIRAAQMLLEWHRRTFIERGGSLKFIFTTVPLLLMEIRESFKSNELSEKQLIDMYSNVTCLILDDFGIEKTTDWTFQTLYIIINNRYENGNLTIITSNLSLDALAEKLDDDRIPSRIKQMCKIQHTKDIDHRLND